MTMYRKIALVVVPALAVIGLTAGGAVTAAAQCVDAPIVGALHGAEKPSFTCDRVPDASVAGMQRDRLFSDGKELEGSQAAATAPVKNALHGAEKMNGAMAGAAEPIEE